MEELFYTIDKEKSELANALVIKIQIGEKSGLTHKVTHSNKPLTQEVLSKVANNRDNSILPFLIKEEIEFARKKRLFHDKSTNFQFVHIPYTNTDQLLKLFATSGKLYLNEKQVTIDLFGKTEFFYLLDTLCSPPSIKGVIKTATQEFDISTCDFTCKGPPHWFIKGISLKIISTEVSWKDFKAAYEQNIRSAQDIFEEAQQDPEAPRVISNAVSYKFQEQEPLPVLLLKDRFGVFADLWMDYGKGAPLVPFEHHSSTVMNEKGITICKRLPAIEQGWEKDLLESDYIKKIVDKTHYYCPADKVSKSIAFLVEIGWQVRDFKKKSCISIRPY